MSFEYTQVEFHKSQHTATHFEQRFHRTGFTLLRLIVMVQTDRNQCRMFYFILDI